MEDKDNAGPWICNAMRSLAMLASDVRILLRESEREREREAMCSRTADECGRYLT